MDIRVLKLGRVGIALACGALSASAISSCQTSPSNASQGNELEIGAAYRTTKPMLAVQWGKEIFLVGDLRAPGSSRPTKVYRIPAGTEIKILEIRAENTITHGIERRAIAIDTGRQHCPSRMSLPANRSENPSLVR